MGGNECLELALEEYVQQKLGEVPSPYRTTATLRQVRTEAEFRYNTLLYDGFDSNGGWTNWRFTQ